MSHSYTVMKMIRNNWTKEKKRKITILSFAVAAVLLVGIFFLSINLGSLKIGFGQMLRGLFVEYDKDVATVYDLRFPRVIIAMFAGAALAVSGVLFQAVMKNPLADPGIIGVCSGAGFVATIITALLPQYLFFTPIAAFIGGCAAFFLVYTLSWKGGLNPLRMILVGVAVNAVFTGLTSAMGTSIASGDMSQAASVVSGMISMKTWDDVKILVGYTVVGLILSLFTVRACNLMALQDSTAGSLGVNVNRNRMIASAVAVLLASIATAVVGTIGFLALIVPHMGRHFVGSDHKKLIPFSMLFGALVLLIADTLGRTIAAPYEISPGIIMNVLGGPFFILLLRRGGRTYGD